jgi:hypothetical protein
MIPSEEKIRLIGYVEAMQAIIEWRAKDTMLVTDDADLYRRFNDVHDSLEEIIQVIDNINI